MSKIQAFERVGNVGVALCGDDNSPVDKLERKLYKYNTSKRQLTREEYLRELQISNDITNGDVEIDWDDDKEVNPLFN